MRGGCFDINSMTRATLTRSVVEVLEDRKLLAAVYPTAGEQYMLELLNRARANPTAEATRLNNYTINYNGTNYVYNGQLNEGLSAGTISTAAKQPLAFNPYLVDAARKHSQWMVDTDTFSHTGASGSNPGTRISAAGYSGASTWGENIAVNWSTGSIDSTSTILKQHNNLFTDVPIAGRGHRLSMMNGSFKEVGIGVATGAWVMSGSNWNALTSTQDFAAKSTTFLTGVAYKDTTVKDNFYTPGEGLSGVIVKATRTSDNQVFTTTTWASGGYSLALPAGTYNIEASGGSLGSTIYYNSVTVGSSNVKRDFVTGQSSDPNPTPTPTPTPTPSGPSFAAINGRTLVVTGTGEADTITVYRKNTTYTAVLNGESMSFAKNLIDVIAILGLAGNDTIKVGPGVWSTFIEGGDGKDHITGGDGPDTIYGNAQPDYLDGGAGDDVLVGAGGHDVIVGGDGDDRIYGNAGNDTIDAGAGNDRIYGGDGDDSIYGGVGRDILYGEAGRDTLNGGPGSDYSDNDPLDRRIAIEILA